MKNLSYYLKETLGIKYLLLNDNPISQDSSAGEFSVDFLWVHLKTPDFDLGENQLFNNMVSAFHAEYFKRRAEQKNSALLDISLEEWLQLVEEISSQTQVIVMHPILLNALGQKPIWSFIQIDSPQILTEHPQQKKQAWKNLLSLIST